MTTIQTIHQYRCDLNHGPSEVTLKTPIMHQDALGDVFRVSVWRSGKPVDLTGMTVRGFLYFAATRQTLLLEGSVTENCACVTLPSECYTIPGYASLVVQVQSGDVRHSVLKVNMSIIRTGSETVLDPGDILPDLAELLGQIAAMEQATAEARTAAAACEGVQDSLDVLAQEIDAVRASAEAAMQEPAAAGSAGQVLTLNADGETEWADSGMEAGAENAGKIMMVATDGQVVPGELLLQSVENTYGPEGRVAGFLEYGIVRESSEWDTTGYIPLPDATGNILTLKFYAATAQWYPFGFYTKENEASLIPSDPPNVYVSTPGEVQVDVPTGAKYFRVSYLVGDIDAIWVKTRLTSEYAQRMDELERNVGTNKLDKSAGADKAGQYLVVDGTGSVVPAPLLVESEVTPADVSKSVEGMLEYGYLSAGKTEWKTTAFIAVPTADTVKLTFYAATAQYYPFMFYYSENQGDQVSGAGPNMYCTVGEHEISVPAGANYFRMSYLAADEGVYWLRSAADSALSKRIGELENRAMRSLMNLQGKRLSIIGDSISTFNGWIPDGYAAYYPYMASMAVVENCWWHRLLTETGMVLGRNCSWSGSMVTGDTDSKTSASCAASDKRIADLVDADGNAPDVIICYIGINDFTSGKTFGDTTGAGNIAAAGTVSDISTAYALMLTKLQAAYPDADIYCCTLTPTLQHYDGTVYTGTFPVAMAGGTLPELNAIIRNIAINLGCGIIDLARCGLNHHNISRNSVDGRLHPDDKGHAMIADKALQALMYN